MYESIICSVKKVQETPMANKLAKADRDGSFRSKKNQNNWKFPIIPIGEVYKDSLLRFFRSYATNDFEETIILNGDKNQNVSFALLASSFQKGFVKKHHRFMHLGLVQIAVKPLIRDGLGAPLAVCLRDTRHPDLHNSLLALVESDLSEGPFYFSCFPSFSFSLADASSLEVMVMKIRTPLALKYRVVCKAILDLSPEALNEPILGETSYFQPATGTHGTTKWDEYKFPVNESSSQAQDGNSLKTVPEGCDLQQGRSMANKLINVEGGISRIKMNPDDWKYPKIPVDEVYNHSHDTNVTDFKKKLRIFPNSVVKDFEKTIKLKANDQNVSLKLLKGLNKFLNNGYVHLGLVQIAVKPLMSDGLGDEVIVCVRDYRILDFEQSLLSVVQSDLSQGPFYFNCCPGYSIPWKERELLTLEIRTSGVPLALTYRVVCKVSTDLTLDIRKPIRGETTYFQPVATTGTECTTKWDEVQFP